MISAEEALQRLITGNQRFVQNVRHVDALASQSRRDELIAGQEPVAIILGCSDSRVPAEMVFDQGFGDLFVIRVAGNVVAPSQIGSVEFAVQRFGIPLVIVLGHTQCGAVIATIDELEKHEKNEAPPNMYSIVERIKPAVTTLMETSLKDDKEALLKHAIRANIRLSADHLRHGSRMLEQLVQSKKLKVVSAEYSLETGSVEFIDNDE
ncbi:MAG: carbonic anhydrase [Granulosicoccaceae bacterium]